MPGSNATGPQGMGQMSGRGMGRCAGSTALSAGRGRGRGGGFGWRNWFRATGLPGWMRFKPSATAAPDTAVPDDLSTVRAELNRLRQRLDAMEKQE